MQLRLTGKNYVIFASILYLVFLFFSGHLFKWVWPEKVIYEHRRARMREKLDTGTGMNHIRKSCNSTIEYPADTFRGLSNCFEKCQVEQYVAMNWAEAKKTHSSKNEKPKIFVSLSVCWDRNTQQYQKQKFPYKMALRYEEILTFIVKSAKTF